MDRKHEVEPLLNIPRYVRSMYPLRITPTEAQRSTITKKDKVSRPCGFLSPPEARPATVPSPEWISKNCDPFRYGQPWRRSPNAISQASISSFLTRRLWIFFALPPPVSPPPPPQGGARAEEDSARKKDSSSTPHSPKGGLPPRSASLCLSRGILSFLAAARQKLPPEKR